MSSLFQEVCESVRQKLGGFRALALVSLDGRIVAEVVEDRTLDPETLLEYATLLRIAHRTSEDTRAGELSEICWTSEQGVVLMRRVSHDSFLTLVGGPGLRTGLGRYLLRRAAWRLRPQFERASR